MEISPFLSPAFREFVWLVCFPPRRFPCPSEPPRDFFSASFPPAYPSPASLSPALSGVSRRAEIFGGNHRVRGERSPCKAAGAALVSPMGQLCQCLWGGGRSGGHSSSLSCGWGGQAEQSAASLSAVVQGKAAQHKYQKVPQIKLNPFPSPTAAVGHNRNLIFCGNGEQGSMQ